MNKTKRYGAGLLLVLLTVFWMIIASSISVTELIIGLLASLLIVLYSMDLVFSKDEMTSFTPRSIRALFILFIRLIIEIVVSNFHVAKIVLSRKLPIDPGFETIRQPLKKDLNKTLYGNAITLTPGTLTVDMTDDGIVVHGLEKHSVKSLEGSKLEQAFMNLEGIQHD
jgi:multicomponent Na+:H+ antiporter subunit E